MLPAGAKVCETQVILEITNLQDQESKISGFLVTQVYQGFFYNVLN